MDWASPSMAVSLLSGPLFSIVPLSLWFLCPVSVMLSGCVTSLSLCDLQLNDRPQALSPGDTVGQMAWSYP